MNSLLDLNIVFENPLDALHKRMKFQMILVGFLCELLAYRLIDYATSSNVRETGWCEECVSLLPELPNDLQEALR
jgi:hypothetical protein